MPYGYSQSLVYANKKASIKSLGVALGRICIRANISVSEVAGFFGVTRMTIYNWFKGDSVPYHSYDEAISDYINHTQATIQIK
jgi:transcriptional regulator with XRE-family HTH domain